jgi:hypothetical protein
MTDHTTDDATLNLYDVYGVSDWPEADSAEFAIFMAKPFASEADAVAAARAAYSDSLEVRVNLVEPAVESPAP